MCTYHDMLIDQLWVCEDCLIYIAYADTSSFEYCDARYQDVTEGEAHLAYYDYHTLSPDANEEPNEFSIAQCDCCQTRLAGSRHPVSAIQRDDISIAL